MWGRGDFGELGIDKQQQWQHDPLIKGDGQHKAKKNTVGHPVHVESLQNVKIARVSVGNCHSAAVTTKGALYTWGGCWSGQLGLGESKRAGVKDKRLQLYFPAPTLVEALHSKHQITRVSCGAVHTAVVSSTGQLFTFGCGDGGRLGLGASGGDSPHPQFVKALERDVVVDVCCANWHSLCLVRAPELPQGNRSGANGMDQRRSDVNARSRGEDGEQLRGYVYAFGSGLHGQVRRVRECARWLSLSNAVTNPVCVRLVRQLGLGKQKVAALPSTFGAQLERTRHSISDANSLLVRRCICAARVPDLHHRKIQCKAIAASSHHSVALSCEGEVFTWGRNASGCLGRVVADDASESADPELVQRSTILVEGFGIGPIVSIAAGDRFTLFATGPWEPRREQEKEHFHFQEKLNRHSKFQS